MTFFDENSLFFTFQNDSMKFHGRTEELLVALLQHLPDVVLRQNLVPQSLPMECRRKVP